MSESGDVTVRVVIEGRVQGVWFRGWTEDEARARGLSGWVRNRSDGSVEALFSGAQAAVREMIALVRQGPPMARVAAVTEHAAAPPGEAGFHTAPTL